MGLLLSWAGAFFVEQQQNKSPKVIDNREFVVTWINSLTVGAVASALGITKKSASTRASYLRKLGVKLPKMRPPVADNLEVAQLNSLIKQHTRSG
ncbi:hypothetical protein [Lentzea sp. NPDC051838]|uniref:hypothetical protein n=1 Tax=Lentzea sp. NPDC051838 TaxID=3154849 RepID=UPI00341BB044